jgi:hypothetical protein
MTITSSSTNTAAREAIRVVAIHTVIEVARIKANSRTHPGTGTR